MKRKLLNSLILGAVCACIIIIAHAIGIFNSLELKTLDWRFRQFAQPERASHDIVMVAIDDKSLKEFKRNGIMWKWPRDLYAVLTRYLHRGGARVIIYDILFSDSDIDRLSTDAAETDGEFSQAIKDAGNVILAMHLKQEEDLLGGDNPYIYKNKYSIEPDEAQNRLPTFSSAVLPITQFQQSIYSLGAVNYIEDRIDGICRRSSLFFNYEDKIIPQMGIAAYMAVNKYNDIRVISSGSYQVGDIQIPVDNNGDYLITWYGKGGPGGPFKYYSIAALISSAIKEEKNEKPLVASAEFKDKIIIIGATAPGLFDYRNTPFTSDQPYPAMEIYATMLSNFLQKDFLMKLEPYISILSILFFSLIISLVVIYIPRIWISIAVLGICIILWFALGFYLFSQQNIWLEIVPAEVSIILSFSCASVLNYQTEGKARRQLKATFGRYLSPIVISEVLEKSEQLQLGGKEIIGTILFSDIKDFTTISENKLPQEIVALLNEYFSLTTEVILKYEGLLDKYLGDAIMAVYGAPLKNDAHAKQACLAALGIQNILKDKWKVGENNRPLFETRIGINTGSMVVGNIGSEHRLDYTAIGDTVNLASRLEGVNKIFGTNIIISDSTYNAVKEDLITRELDILRVKGKQQPVVIYELLDTRNQMTNKMSLLIANFQEGLSHYRKRDFKKALMIYEAINTSKPNGDGPSQVYIQKCMEYIATPPPANWDGINNLDMK